MRRQMSHLRKTLFQFRKTGAPYCKLGLFLCMGIRFSASRAANGAFFVYGDTIFGLSCSKRGLF